MRAPMDSSPLNILSLYAPHGSKREIIVQAHALLLHHDAYPILFPNSFIGMSALARKVLGALGIPIHCSREPPPYPKIVGKSDGCRIVIGGNLHILREAGIDLGRRFN